jgi:hypothetical protein
MHDLPDVNPWFVEGCGPASPIKRSALIRYAHNHKIGTVAAHYYHSDLDHVFSCSDKTSLTICKRAGLKQAA